MKPFKCHKHQNKNHFNRPLNKGVMGWLKLFNYFLWSMILCSLCTDKLYRQLLLYISYDKNNLYIFVSSECFLVPTTTTSSMRIYYSTIQLYNQLIISLVIAVHDVYMQLRYIICMMLLLSSQLYSLSLSKILKFKQNLEHNISERIAGKKNR